MSADDPELEAIMVRLHDWAVTKAPQGGEPNEISITFKPLAGGFGYDINVGFGPPVCSGCGRVSFEPRCATCGLLRKVVLVALPGGKGKTGG